MCHTCDVWKWKSDNLQESVPSFIHVGPRDQTHHWAWWQQPFLLSYLADPLFCFLFVCLFRLSLLRKILESQFDKSCKETPCENKTNKFRNKMPCPPSYFRNQMLSLECEQNIVSLSFRNKALRGNRANVPSHLCGGK